MAWSFTTVTGTVEWHGEASALLETLETGLYMRGYTEIEGVMVSSHNGRFWTWQAQVSY